MKENNEKLAYKNLLIRYETSFARIISILTESGNVNSEMTKDLLLASKGNLDDFFEEIKTIKRNDETITTETEEVIRKRLLEEIEEERMLQKKYSIKRIPDPVSDIKSY